MDEASVPGPKRFLGKCLGWGSLALALLVVALAVVRSQRDPVSNLATLEAPIVGVASRVGGPIKHLAVSDNQAVSEGDVLFQIDPEPYELAVAGALANLEALRGDLENIRRQINAQIQRATASEAALAQSRTHLAETRETYERIAPLLEKRYASPEEVDTARRAMESAAAGVLAAESESAAAHSDIAEIAPIEARILEAEALLGQAELAVRDCTVRAPFDGRVAGLNLARGAFVTPGVNVLMLVDTGQWHVNADFAEHILEKIVPGQKATVRLMTAPGKTFEGRVESTGWAVTNLPELPIAQIPFIRRELDWVRLTQRFPVRIRFVPGDVPPDVLRSGATASVTVHTRSTP